MFFKNMIRRLKQFLATHSVPRRTPGRLVTLLVGGLLGGAIAWGGLPWLAPPTPAQAPTVGIEVAAIDRQTRTDLEACLLGLLDQVVTRYRQSFEHFDRNASDWERVNGPWPDYETEQRNKIFEDVEAIEEKLFGLSRSNPYSDLEYYAAVRHLLHVLRDYLDTAIS